MANFDKLKNGGIFGKGVLNPYGQFFIGDTFLNGLTTSPDEKISVGTVTFEPGSRNNWHIHHVWLPNSLGDRWGRMVPRRGTARTIIEAG